MFSKGSKLYPILFMKCPRCHEGDLFETGTFSFSKPFVMPDHCPVCKQNYMPEPGFYYGSMFLSYIMMGFFCLAFAGGLMWFGGWDVNSSIIALTVVCAIFFVAIFRYSRSLWIGINVKYDRNANINEQ